MAISRRSRALKRRFDILKRDHFRCQYCGAQGFGVVLEVDHIQPLSLGGEDEDCNLLTACHRCNAGKRDHPIDSWWVDGKQALLASGDAAFYPFDDIVASEKADYQSFCEVRDRRQVSLCPQ